MLSYTSPRLKWQEGLGFPLFSFLHSPPLLLYLYLTFTHTHTPPTLHTSQASDLFIHLLEVSVLPGITGVPTVLRAVQILVMLSQAPLMWSYLEVLYPVLPLEIPQVHIYSGIIAVVYLLSHVWLFCNPMNCSPSGSSVYGISQARILEQIAIFFSWDLRNPRIKPVSPALIGGFFTTGATWEATLEYYSVRKKNQKCHQQQHGYN